MRRKLISVLAIAVLAFSTMAGCAGEQVVNEVRDSVKTSNGSVSDLSALTEELSATMQDMSENASLINTNTEAVATMPMVSQIT